MLQKFIVALYVSIWYKITNHEKVKPEHVVSSAVAYCVIGSAIYFGIAIIFFNSDRKLLGYIALLGDFFLICKGSYFTIMKKSGGSKKWHKDIRIRFTDSALLSIAVKNQFGLDLKRLPLWILLLLMISYASTQDFSMFAIFLGVVFFYCLDAFWIIGIVLVDKDPTKKEENKETGDFSLNGA